jgi:hypothetical protein
LKKTVFLSVEPGCTELVLYQFIEISYWDMIVEIGGMRFTKPNGFLFIAWLGSASTW